MPSISLKMTPKEAKAEGFGKPEDVKPPAYPWGTAITLTDEQVKGLWPNGVPEKETKLELDVAAYVKGINLDDREGGEKRVEVTLQLTDIALETDPDSDLAARMYGKDGPQQSKD